MVQVKLMNTHIPRVNEVLEKEKNEAHVNLKGNNGN